LSLYALRSALSIEFLGEVAREGTDGREGMEGTSGYSSMASESWCLVGSMSSLLSSGGIANLSRSI
jgi:hypothetical protein